MYAQNPRLADQWLNALAEKIGLNDAGDDWEMPDQYDNDLEWSGWVHGLYCHLHPRPEPERQWPAKPLPDKYKDAFESVQRKQHILLDAIDSLLEDTRQNALHITGRAGTGKSHLITEYLSAQFGEGHNAPSSPWRYMQGTITPGGLFDFCEEAQNKIIVFDDVVQLIASKENYSNLLILMAPGTNRVLTYRKKGEDGESSFHFRGKIITIANIVFGGDSVADAIADRVNTIVLDYTPEEMEAFLAHLACQGQGELSPDECLEVLGLITPLFPGRSRLTLRWFLNKALSMYALSKRGIGTRVHWLDRIAAEIQRENTDNVAPLTMDDKKHIMEEIVLESYKRWPNRSQADERLKFWEEQTRARLHETKKRGMFYETVKRLRAEGRLEN